MCSKTVLSLNVVSLTFAGVHRYVLFDCGVSELQHVPRDRHDVASDLPGTRAPEDMPGSVIRLHPAARPLHHEEHIGHPRRHIRDGSLLLLLGDGEQEEVSRRRPSGVITGLISLTIT